MTKTDTSGPAFPVTVKGYDGDELNGLTIRDYFAAHCPDTINDLWAISQGRGPASEDVIYTWYSEHRFRYADAMLKAREEAGDD